MNLQKRFNELSQEKRKRIQKILEEYKDSPCYKTTHEKQTESELAQLRAENARLKQENELYAAEMSAAREAGFYSAQELFMAYQNLKAECAKAHDEALIESCVAFCCGAWNTSTLGYEQVLAEFKKHYATRT